MNSDELKKRTKEYALQIIELVKILPNDVAGRAVGNQLIRSGTSLAANYRAACRARSRQEFIAKIGVVIEEADESAFWLELIIGSGLLSEQLVSPLLEESNELVSIFVSTNNTARKNRK